MKASEIFNDCHGRYRGLREWLADAAGAIHSVNLEKPSFGYLWRPDRARACEYVADFERIGRRSLARSEWKGRLKLFNICFVHSVEYRRAIRLVGVSEGTFDYWYAEVKRAAGAEFARSELFPPWRYFLRRNQHAPKPNRQPCRAEQRPEARTTSRAFSESAGESERTETEIDLGQPERAETSLVI